MVTLPDGWKVVRSTLLRDDDEEYLVIGENPEPTEDFRYALFFVRDDYANMQGDFADLAEANDWFDREVAADQQLQRDWPRLITEFASLPPKPRAKQSHSRGCALWPLVLVLALALTIAR